MKTATFEHGGNSNPPSTTLHDRMQHSLTYLHGKRDRMQAFLAAYVVYDDSLKRPVQEVTSVIPSNATREQSERIMAALRELSKLLHEVTENAEEATSVVTS